MLSMLACESCLERASHPSLLCRDAIGLGTFNEAPGTAQSPGVRAGAQCCKIDILKWLEELVSQSNTIQAQEDISAQGRLQAISG